MDKDTKIVKLKLDIIFKRVFGNEKTKILLLLFCPICLKYLVKALKPSISAMLSLPRNI